MKKYILCGTLLVAVTTGAIFKINSEFPITSTIHQLQPANKGEYLLKDFTAQNSIDGFAVVNNNIEIYSKSQRFGMAVAGVGSGNKYSPIVNVSKFNFEAGTSQLEQYPLNLSHFTGKSVPYEIIDPTTKGTLGSNTTDFAYEDIKSKYPQCFNFTTALSKASITDKPELVCNIKFVSFDLSSSIKKSTIDYNGTWVVTNPVTTIVPTPPTFEGEHKILAWASLFNATENNITVVAGANRKDLKNQCFKEMAYVTYNAEGKIISQVDQKFDFTKDHEFFGLAANLDNGAKQVVAILGDRMYMGKQNDPEPCKYTILALNPDGSKLLSATFKYGVKNGEFKPQQAYIKSGKVYLITRNNSISGIEIFSIDAAGSLNKISSVAYADLMVASYGTLGNGNANKGFGMFTPSPLQHKLIAVKQLQNGNMVFVMDEVSTESVATTDPMTGAAATINVNRYTTIVGLELTAEGRFVAQYIFQKDSRTIQTPTTVENVFIVNNKVVIMTVDKIATIKNFDKQRFSDLNTYATKGCKEQCSPTVFTIDSESKKTLTMRPSEPLFVTLYGTGSYVLVNNNKDVLYVGIKNDGNPNAIEYKVVKFTF